jgi:hypothetical protein
MVCPVRECVTMRTSSNSLHSSTRLVPYRRCLHIRFPPPRSNICRAHAALLQCCLDAQQHGEAKAPKPGWGHRVLKAARVFFGMIAVFVACDILHFLGGTRPPTDGQAWRNLAAREEDNTSANSATRRQPIIIYDRHKKIIAQFASSTVIPLCEVRIVQESAVA